MWWVEAWVERIEERRILFVAIITILLELLALTPPNYSFGLTPVLIAILVAILQAIAPTNNFIKFGLMLFIGSVINTTNYFGVLSIM